MDKSHVQVYKAGELRGEVSGWGGGFEIHNHRSSECKDRKTHIRSCAYVLPSGTTYVHTTHM